MSIDLLPAKLVLLLASAYIAGKSAEEALSLAQKLYKQDKFTATMDVLGEQAASLQTCQNYVEKYSNLIDLVSQNPLPVQDKQKQLTISFKPSMFCVSPSIDAIPTQKNFDEGFDRITSIVEYGAKHNVLMTLEAEDYRWTDFHLDTYFALLSAGYSNIGTVLQTRLLRTQKDVQRFDQRGRVRLVIGIYEEGPEVAHTSKQLMKNCLITSARELLDRGTYVELATHDQDYIKRFFAEVVLPQRVNPSKFETQFLYGVPRLQLEKMLATGEYFKQWQLTNHNLVDESHLEILSQSGITVRLYLPFGSDESIAPYCKRRLKENPNLLIYGLKNLLGVQ